MPPPKLASLWQAVRDTDLSARRIADAHETATLAELASGSRLGAALPGLAGQSVLLATTRQLATALALIELDGVVRRLIICPADLSEDILAAACRDADVDAVVTDRDVSNSRFAAGRRVVRVGGTLVPIGFDRAARHATEWVLFTSGTTGTPKMVVHDVSGLTGAITPREAGAPPPAWATFYDIRRYGGLQIFLRAVLGGGSLVLSDPQEKVADHLHRLQRHGVSHISGTPSHWRRVLMSPAATAFTPGYVRLSGEIADQAVLDRLRALYPEAKVGHAYASTEAGVGFEVNDGLEGFPAALLDHCPGNVELAVRDGSLIVRSRRSATHYLGGRCAPVAGDDGFIDSGDLVSQARRPLPLCRASGWRHQCRRPKGEPRGGRGGSSTVILGSRPRWCAPSEIP